ncbi:MAG: hypothetical protein MJA29_07710 [Candidatus Omnitrophica bacterium]|nr:hypothetical protein [Candidatus Omnitrophota bacterium]
MAKKVLLGIDFIGANFPAALYTIQQWWAYVNRSKEHVCVLGISNFADKNSVLPGARNLTPLGALKTISAFVPVDQISQWTSDVDARLLALLERRGIQSRPFYSEFNYGSVVNRLLLLAFALDCEYLVRVDPGTLPPKGKTFCELMDEHEREIGGDPLTVVSRRYANRLALRDIFVRRGLESQHEHKVKFFTGIDVHSQVTGGAMLTFRTPGFPAVCFPTGTGLTLVWASDDGIYRVLDETKSKSKMLQQDPVERFDADGKLKKPKEYYRGILGAIYLKTVRDGDDIDTARKIAGSFVMELAKDILDDRRCSEIDSAWRNTFVANVIAPKAFVNAIRDGWVNYSILCIEWERICGILQHSITSEMSAKNRIETVVE